MTKWQRRMLATNKRNIIEKNEKQCKLTKNLPELFFGRLNGS